MADIQFEFGATKEASAFWERHPNFWPPFQRLIALVNKCFGRQYQPQNHAEDVCFNLGQACVEDFGQIAILAVQGQGNGATKLLRGLFERVVTIAYLTKNPEKAERFVRFAAIQEHRAMEAALKLVSEEEFDKVLDGKTTVAQIRKYYQEIKPEFQTLVCSRCDKKRTASSWDLDVAAMVHRVGDTFSHFYLGAYALPNLSIHATLASTARDRFQREEADAAFSHAWGLLLLVLKYQNLLFSLGIEDDIAACERAVVEIWMQS